MFFVRNTIYLLPQESRIWHKVSRGDFHVCMYVCVCVGVFNQPFHHGQKVIQDSFFERLEFSFLFWVVGIQFSFLGGWNSVFVKAKESLQPDYLSIAKGRTDGVMSFSRALVQSEIQTAFSRIWTCIDNSISYDDNSYTKSASFTCMCKSKKKLPSSRFGLIWFLCLMAYKP